ncbi:MAG: FmdB family transcriptional regulator [Nitrospirae bacterium RIFOXYB2_FULL_43_5]|nr:MAG: FmdB family transcriptional regulator [Nitrospirae bacterium GWF2_44_13]OGW65789.1 MAG: FmdB family transcriptional regulator [Nitrospirae bacterium RIFOXYA2_FULL_44_9]OGW73763.1 MAG: FmdB family transcriptional regulator [Nitrospirae bacterium RIFOXYB2_FULL_43_5]HBG92717.1 FmdB family transcriptional regulator [Nitrospiraceae bacterium]HBU05135.1 FmdB family transcriptional regulator [Nitrospiraceae bacterium]
MPVYEYKCTKCKEDFEKLVFGSQKVTCPKCNSSEIKKKMSIFGMSGVEKPFAGSSSASCSSCTKSTCTSCH